MILICVSFYKRVFIYFMYHIFFYIVLSRALPLARTCHTLILVREPESTNFCFFYYILIDLVEANGLIALLIYLLI